MLNFICFYMFIYIFIFLLTVHENTTRKLHDYTQTKKIQKVKTGMNVYHSRDITR